MDHRVAINLIKEYESLQWRYRADARAHKRRAGPLLFAQGFERMREIAVLLHAHYLRVAGEEYRAALWHRRMWLHGCGRHGAVYDGTDALRWRREHERGEVAC